MWWPRTALGEGRNPPAVRHRYHGNKDGLPQTLDPSLAAGHINTGEGRQKEGGHVLHLHGYQDVDYDQKDCSKRMAVVKMLKTRGAKKENPFPTTHLRCKKCSSTDTARG